MHSTHHTLDGVKLVAEGAVTEIKERVSYETYMGHMTYKGHYHILDGVKLVAEGAVTEIKEHQLGLQCLNQHFTSQY